MSDILTSDLINSTKYKWCNHHHELTDRHEIVTIGGNKFVANKKAIPLLQALNDVGLITTSHHIDKPDENAFIQISMDNVHCVEMRDGKLTIQWEQDKAAGSNITRTHDGQYRDCKPNRVGD